MEFLLRAISEQTLTEGTEYIIWQDITDADRKEIKISQQLEKLLVWYASLELAENTKDEQQITDLEKEENSTGTHFFIFSISTFCIAITTEREQGGITGRHNNFRSCFRP